MPPSEGDHDHHVPAGDDWPRRFGEASWWPPVTGLGIIGLYVGIGLLILGLRSGDPLVDPALGVAVIVSGLLVAVSGAAGWTYHAFIV